MKHSFRLFDNKHLKRIKGKLINSIDFVLNYGAIENETPWDIWKDLEDKCILHLLRIFFLKHLNGEKAEEVFSLF